MLKDYTETKFVNYRIAIGTLAVNGIFCEFVPSRRQNGILLNGDHIRTNAIKNGRFVSLACIRDGSEFVVSSNSIRDLIGE